MKKNSLFLAIILSSLMIIQPVYATYDPLFYSKNDILFYDGKNTDCATSASKSIDLEGSADLQNIFQLLLNGGFNTVQTAAIMGNMYQESGFNSDEHEAGNDIGYGLVQWSFDRRTALEAYAASKGKAPSDVPTQIDFLVKEYNKTYKSTLNGTAFNGSEVSAATEAWMIKFEAPAMRPEGDPARLNSVRIPAAIKIYGLYKDLSSNPTVATTDGCSSNAIIAGNLVATAINLAWDKPVTNGTTQKSQARDTYQTAKEQYNPSVDWTDCGGFVATVMISSGVDKNYPNVSVTTQAAYVRSHTEKYQIIDNPQVSDLLPGDILILDSGNYHHTTIHTGGSPYPTVDASLGDRVPGARDSSSDKWMIDNGAFVARLIQ